MRERERLHHRNPRNELRDTLAQIGREFPIVGTIRRRRRAAEGELLRKLSLALDDGTITQTFGDNDDYIIRVPFLRELLSDELTQVQILNPSDPECPIGLGQAGPIFYLHDYAKAFLTPTKITDIRRGALVSDHAVFGLFKSGQKDEIQVLASEAIERYPFNPRKVRKT